MLNIRDPLMTPLLAPPDDGDQPMLDVNTTPLIDVLLVLLVMLIITIPVQLHAVNLALPVAQAPQAVQPSDKIRIDIDAKDGVHWQGDLLDLPTLERNMAEIARQPSQPEVHLRADRAASYQAFAAVLAASKRQGLNRLAVVGAEQFAE